MLFRRIVFYALLVGGVAGLLLTVAQIWQVIPIIESAETMEDALAASHEAAGHSAAAHSHSHGAHDHGGGAWAPSDGVERTAYTLLANVLIAIGLALILLAAMVASLRSDASTRLDWRHGLLWGAAGYAVFFLAPALGIPPEIPGQAGAPLEARQFWWLIAVLCTAAGLAGVAFGKSPWRWAFLGLLVVPYLIGVPQGPNDMFPGHPPAAAAELEGLARQFFSATAVANAVLWLALGLASVWAVRRIVPPSE
jgi:cobalt transporter subunit CbtA